MFSAAILIKKERSKDPSYTFKRFSSEAEISESKVEVPSSLRKAVDELANSSSDLRLVSLKYTDPE
jgi:hypothetical protein